MRLWLLSILIAAPLFGFSYSPLLLKAQASIFPKLLLLAKEPEKLLVKGSIVFAIVYEDEDREAAFGLKTMMEQQYKGRIEGYPFKVILIQFSELNETLECSAVMAMHSDKHIDEPVKLAIQKKIVSFVADAVYLKEGYLFSLNLERSTVIYMNKPMLPYYGIEFSDTLYHVVRFFDENKKAHSLSTKIVISVALVFLVIFLTIFLVFDKINKDALYTAERDKAEMIAEMFAPILAVELYLDRNENVLSIANQITENPNILSFELVQDGKRIVSRKNKTSFSKDTGENFNVETVLTHPVNHEPIATLYLAYSSAHYHHLAWQYRIIFLITFGVLSFLILLFTFYLRYLLTPLKRIASEVRGFTPGQELLLPSYKENNEIGNIAAALKLMNVRITDFAQQQENTAQFLEQEVAKKTTQLSHQLYTDALTGCPNRIRLMEDISEVSDGILLLVNIDEFQQINDFYGHIAGDHVLNTLAKILTNVSSGKKDMTVYKLSADEFALLTAMPMGYNSLELFLSQLSTHIESTPIYYEEATLNIRITLGATMNIKDGMEKADIALKTARIRHKPFMIYDENLNIEHQYHQNMQWVQRLTAAIAEDRIVPYFQPVFDNQTGDICSYECLVRLIETDGNVLTPFHFLEISKKARLYTRLTSIMIEKSCRHFRDKNDHFSVNLSVDDILDSHTVSFIKEQISTCNVADRIIFEILESVGIENYPEIFNFIEEMKALGCQFAIDDFGSGYSNFEHLLKLRIDYIKIDGSLIRNLHTDSNAVAVIQAIVHFAHKRQMICIAEFVHNAEVYEIVKKLGIERSQGFYLGEPRPDTLG